MLGPSLRMKKKESTPPFGLTHRRAIKEETIAINRDWVQNQACRLSHDIQVISNPYITLYNLFEFITKIRFSNNLF